MRINIHHNIYRTPLMQPGLRFSDWPLRRSYWSPSFGLAPVVHTPAFAYQDILNFAKRKNRIRKWCAVQITIAHMCETWFLSVRSHQPWKALLSNRNVMNVKHSSSECWRAQKIRISSYPSRGSRRHIFIIMLRHVQTEQHRTEIWATRHLLHVQMKTHLFLSASVATRASRNLNFVYENWVLFLCSVRLFWCPPGSMFSFWEVTQG